MPSFETQRVAADNRNLVRKIQKAMCFVGDVAGTNAVTVPSTLFHTDGTLIDLQVAKWKPLGMVSPDGYTFGRDVSTEEVNALGYASSIRSDPTAVARTVSFTPLETGRRALKEIQLGQSLATNTQSIANGEVVIDHVDLPVNADYRLLVVGLDGATADQWLMGRLYPSVKLGNTGEETWGNEGALSQQLTFNVFSDATLGTPCREFFGGTGAKLHKTALGYTQGTV